MKTQTIKMVDDLGRLQAQIADLEVKAKSIKSALAENGEGAYEGDLFRATVSKTERSTVSLKDACSKLEELGVSHQWFTAHTNVTPVTCVRVVARTAVAA